MTFPDVPDPVSEGSGRRKTPAGLPEFCVTDTHVPLLFLGPDLASRPRIHALSVLVDILFGFTKVLCIGFGH